MALARLQVNSGSKGKALPHAEYICRQGKYEKKPSTRRWSIQPTAICRVLRKMTLSSYGSQQMKSRERTVARIKRLISEGTDNMVTDHKYKELLIEWLKITLESLKSQRTS